MTGYGRGRADHDGRRAVVEMRSVNHRFLDVKIRGSSVDPAIAEQLTKAVRDACQRGVVTVSIRLQMSGAQAVRRVDLEAARKVHAELTQLAHVLESSAPVSLALVCQQPGVLVAVESDDETETAADAACVAEAAKEALDGLLRMRAAEGQALAREVENRLQRVRAIVERIAAEAAGQPDAAHQRLSARVGRLLETRGAELDAERLAQEVALLADRVDITEELVRLRSHLDHVATMVKDARDKGQPVGRRLEFLGQEMGREVNTIGSKSQSATIAREVVEAKAELEKIREQVQNIE